MTKKLSITLAVALLLAGLGAEGYAVERFIVSNESYSQSDKQAAEAEQLKKSDINRAAQLMEFAAENAELASKQRGSSYFFGALGGGFMVAAAFLLAMAKRKQGDSNETAPSGSLSGNP